MAEETLKGGAAAAKTAAQEQLDVDLEALGDVDGSDAPVSETSLITQPDFAPAKPGAQLFVGRISLPILAVAHGVGGLAEAGFSPGDLVLDKDCLLAYPARPANKNEGSGPIRAIIVNWCQYFKEYKPAPGVKPRVFRTAKEAQDAGFTTQRDPVTGELPSAPPAMTWTLLIEKPADLVSSHFCVTDPEDGIVYAPARMFIDKGAYLSVSDAFGKANNFTCAQRGIDSVVWEMNTRLRSAASGNSRWVPTIRLIEHLNDTKLVRMRRLLQR